MNYLAHLYLAEATPESRLGNLLGDFRRGLCLERLSEPIRQGIQCHQAVDCFTDQHPLVRCSKHRLHPGYRHFSGVLIDIFYDHFLACHWSEYSRQSLHDFSQEVYDDLLSQRQYWPESFQRVIPHMVQDNWLCRYQDICAIHLTLRRVARRFKREAPLAIAMVDLLHHYSDLEADFQAFFPELIQAVKTHKLGS